MDRNGSLFNHPRIPPRRGLRLQPWECQAGDCKDWIVAFTRTQADRIFSEFVPDESPENVTEMTREEYWSTRAADNRVTEETVEHCFLNAPCHLSTTET